MPGFLPGGLIQTAAQAVAVGGMRSRSTGRRRRRRASKRTGTTRRKRASGSKRKPRPGTKAWMSYIRGMRRKRRK